MFQMGGFLFTGANPPNGKALLLYLTQLHSLPILMNHQPNDFAIFVFDKFNLRVNNLFPHYEWAVLSNGGCYQE